MVLITETVGLVSTGRQKRKKNSPFTLPQMNEHFGYSRNEYRYGGGAQWTSSGWAAGKTSLQIQAHIIATHTRNVCATNCPIDILGHRLVLTRDVYEAFKYNSHNIFPHSQDISHLVAVLMQHPDMNRDNAQAIIDEMMAALGIRDGLRGAIGLQVEATLRARERQERIDSVWDAPAWQIFYDPTTPTGGIQNDALLLGLLALPLLPILGPKKILTGAIMIGGTLGAYDKGTTAWEETNCWRATTSSTLGGFVQGGVSAGGGTLVQLKMPLDTSFIARAGFGATGQPLINIIAINTGWHIEYIFDRILFVDRETANRVEYLTDEEITGIVISGVVTGTLSNTVIPQGVETNIIIDALLEVVGNTIGNFVEEFIENLLRD